MFGFKRFNKQLSSIIQTDERLPQNNGVYEGFIASDKIHNYLIIKEQYFQSYEGNYWETELVKLDVVKIPTNEELAAVDAVKKAEESLKAAKKSLELIKENK